MLRISLYICFDSLCSSCSKLRRESLLIHGVDSFTGAVAVLFIKHYLLVYLIAYNLNAPSSMLPHGAEFIYWSPGFLSYKVFSFL